MVAKVVALYRYPVKGFTPQPVERITVLPGGRVAGDRVLNFRFADAPAADTEWCRKYHGVVLANTPGLARLQVRFDEQAQRLTIALGARSIADETLDPAGRSRLIAVLMDYVLGLDVNPLHGEPSRLPLKLIGDGTTPRYQDNQAGQVTLHSRESLAAVATALGDPQLSEARFRHNIAIEGVPAWTEQSWIGKSVRIGEVVFETLVPKTRCLATHANPLTGERDRSVMQTLVGAFAQKEPTFGVGMLAATGGVICLGDRVEPA